MKNLKFILFSMLALVLTFSTPIATSIAQNTPENTSIEQPDATTQPPGQTVNDTQSKAAETPTPIPPLVFYVDEDTLTFDANTPIQVIVETIALYKETKKDPPKGIAGWLVFLVGLFATGRLNVFITGITSTVKQAKGLWAKIKAKTYRTPLLLSLGGGALWTFYKGTWTTFDIELYPIAVAVIFSATIFIYEEFVKVRLKEETPSPSPLQPAT